MSETTPRDLVGSGAHPSLRSLPLPRWLAHAALVLLLLFIGIEGLGLWNEWSALQDELRGAKRMEVIGYPGIQPRYSYARRPANWFRIEGPQTFLWGGWVEGVGHTWFLTGTGDLDPSRLQGLRSRDVQLAIDEVISETEGGTVWSRVPDEAIVLAETLAGVPTAYPLLVLDKVGVVNDEILNRPFLVTYNPYADEESRVIVYDPLLDGRRVTMGTTGYYVDHKPMLYDRGSESLWVDAGDGLAAVTGKHKGKSLRQIVRAKPVAWRAWRHEHPEGRLVIGADRSGSLPES